MLNHKININGVSFIQYYPLQAPSQLFFSFLSKIWHENKTLKDYVAVGVVFFFLAWVSVSSESNFRFEAPADGCSGPSGATSGCASASGSCSGLASGLLGADSLPDDRFGLPRFPVPGVGVEVGL